MVKSPKFSQKEMCARVRYRKSESKVPPQHVIYRKQGGRLNWLCRNQQMNGGVAEAQVRTAIERKKKLVSSDVNGNDNSEEEKHE